MPLLPLKDESGRVRWAYVLIFTSHARARSFVDHSLVSLRILEGKGRFLVCSPEDARWAIRCGYRIVTQEPR